MSDITAEHRPSAPPSRPTPRRPDDGRAQGRPVRPNEAGQTELFLEGADWESVADAIGDETLILNMGPQHPSTHGVLRLVLELDGEVVTNLTPIIGYLHTGIEKSAEYRNWVQGTTFFTRMDYLAPLHNELAYCLGVERLLDIEVPAARAGRPRHPHRVQPHRQPLRVARHRRDGARLHDRHDLRVPRARAHPRPVRVAVRAAHEPRLHPPRWARERRHRRLRRALRGAAQAHPRQARRVRGPAHQEPDLERPPARHRRHRRERALALGVTGPLLRAAGVAHDLRKVAPYSGIEQYDFDVPTSTDADSYARYTVRIEEMRQSLRIIRQALDTLPSGPVMVADKHIAAPSQQQLGEDGMGNDPAYIRHIMGESMEALINHFKLTTEGFTVPAGQVYSPSSRPAASSATRSPPSARTSRGACTCASPPSSTSRPHAR
jgi:NADH-quinone oxidoreductase subunit D